MGEPRRIMTDLIEDTNPRDLRELLGQIHGKETALPDFQRDFVWDPKMTQELIVSIAHSYPSGSLLRIRNSGRLFASREFQGAPALAGAVPTYLVLDGQQRLSSLYQAFFGVGDHLYFIDINHLLAGEDFEDAIFHLRADSRRSHELAYFETQAAQLTLPLSILRRGVGEFHRWAMRAGRKLPDEHQRTQLEDKLRDVADEWLEPIERYRFPVVTLSSEASIDAVCTIFETLNRTGVKLSPFELLSARFWPESVNLRKLWDQAKRDYSIIDDFEIDPYYSLQAVSLVARSAPSVKRGDVLGLESSSIQKWWDPIVLGLSRALETLRDDCGVLVPRWLPYNTLVVPMAAVLAKSGVVGTPKEGAARQKLVRWFWCSVFGQTYENTPTGQSVKDFVELISWLGGGQEPGSVSKFSFDAGLLPETTVRQRAIYNGVICSILRRAPRDFHSGAKLTPTLIETSKIEDHHIFPKDFLAGQNVPRNRIDSVLNRTLIDKITNIRISNRAPSNYLLEIRHGMAAGDFQALLQSHVLPTEQNSPLFKDDYPAFLEWRGAAINQEITQLTGIP